MIKRKTDTDMQYVPYKDTGALMPDLRAMGWFGVFVPGKTPPAVLAA